MLGNISSGNPISLLTFDMYFNFPISPSHFLYRYFFIALRKLPQNETTVAFQQFLGNRIFNMVFVFRVNIKLGLRDS